MCLKLYNMAANFVAPVVEEEAEYWKGYPELKFAVICRFFPKKVPNAHIALNISKSFAKRTAKHLRAA